MQALHLPAADRHGVEDQAGDVVERCAIGLIGLGPTPLRASAAEEAVLGTPAAELDLPAIGKAAVNDLTEVPSDLHGSAEYRAAMVKVYTRRALVSALQRAQG